MIQEMTTKKIEPKTIIIGTLASLSVFTLASLVCKTFLQIEFYLALAFIVINIATVSLLNMVALKTNNILVYGVMAKFGKSFLLIIALVGLGLLLKVSNFVGLLIPFMAGYGTYLLFDLLNLLKTIKKES